MQHICIKENMFHYQHLDNDLTIIYSYRYLVLASTGRYRSQKQLPF